MEVKAATRVCIQNAHVTAPNTLPTHISPLNQPYSSHTRGRSSSSIRRHRQNIVPPPTALTQNAAICGRKCHHAQQQRQPQLTVTPQLAYAASSCACSGLLNAVLHACAQNDSDMIVWATEGGGGGAGCATREEPGCRGEECHVENSTARVYAQGRRVNGGSIRSGGGGNTMISGCCCTTHDNNSKPISYTW